MKIISNFRDYYDFVAHQLYSGGDEKIVFVRKNKIQPEVILPYCTDIPIVYTNSKGTISFKWLLVCNKRYLLISNEKDCSNLNKFRIVNQLDFNNHLSDYYYRAKFESFVGQESRQVVDILKLLEIPIAIVDEIAYDRKLGTTRVKVNPVAPFLEKLGFTSIKDPYTLYQDLYHFMANVIRTNPDVSPPVEINNKQRIVQHGFDLKQSFRHRKKIDQLTFNLPKDL